MIDLINAEAVKARLTTVHGEVSLLDRDIAALYGVSTREVNQAVRNNPDKFPAGFCFQMTEVELRNWKSRILTSNLSDEEKSSVRMGVRRPPFAFTERGLYMLATVLKGAKATSATLAIVNAYAQLRSMVRDMEALQSLKDGSPEQTRQLTATGHKLAELIGENLSTDSTETTIELNLAVLKISHKFTRKKKSVKLVMQLTQPSTKCRVATVGRGLRPRRNRCKTKLPLGYDCGGPGVFALPCGRLHQLHNQLIQIRFILMDFISKRLVVKTHQKSKMFGNNSLERGKSGL